MDRVLPGVGDSHSQHEGRDRQRLSDLVCGAGYLSGCESVI